MDYFSAIQMGFATAFEWNNLVFCFVGVALGTIVGLLPGIGALSTISMLLPLTFYMEPTTAIIMLAGVFYGAQYGGSIASILLNIPGTATNAITCLDGYPLARDGRAGVALAVTTLSSFVGGTFAILVLMFMGPMLADVALAFGAPEYTSIMVFGLIAASTLSGGSMLKGLAMVIAGVVLGTVGMDMNTGVQRFQFGRNELSDGLSIVAIAMGLFGVAEILVNLMRSDGSPFKVHSVTLRSLIPTKKDVKESTMPTVRGTLIGTVLGILPGTGATIASFISYATEKRVSKTPQIFGKGAMAGISAPEAANNAAVQSAFIPTLSLGIPGDAIMAVMLGALMIHGISPGPGLVNQHPELFWGLIASFWIGNVMLLILNLPFIGVFVRILKIPYDALYVAMLFFICVGVFSIRNNVFDIFLVIGFGIVGVFMILGRYPAAPLLLGFILGPMIEENMRRALLLSRGSFDIFVSTPVSASFVVLSVVVLVATAGLPMLRKGIRTASNDVAVDAKD
ncbi:MULTISPECIES: tripartite tricarboxylate transporter permease [unclassified Devosia]|uniref:tripartite tricarboxylate transporter permease n=1 Tax=unclassified Devosia TaxID=196773 RepID=UPI00145C3EBD|nr:MULTISPECIES: tripartite tricarboxylate transporter permease [unclassified Devosia]MBJ6989118.1 tripartite tricarboxylate transporter permease [Devosia sp. MC521]QMW63318.1 tripartite tricarboxylate transporter permease [Devosia sp. MC521]